MKKPLILFVALAALLSFTSCDDYETYGEMKEKERDAISEYIRSEKINVIGEGTFHAQGDSTSVEKNEFVYLTNSGVYMQIVRKGAGEKLEENKQVNLLCRYLEYNIKDKAIQSRNDYSPRNYDKMTVTRTGSQYTASFSSGVMYSTYGASVPAGWLVPLQYIRVGRQTTPDAEIAKVRLIVPHTQGHSYATSSVYPCYYEITYQREK
ncbi:MAG: DUF4827 domain-containing protein [Prevotella sp.]|nr:DUF4827 domain-containing protein [Prevotella sp.]